MKKTRILALILTSLLTASCAATLAPHSFVVANLPAIVALEDTMYELKQLAGLMGLFEPWSDEELDAAKEQYDLFWVYRDQAQDHLAAGNLEGYKEALARAQVHVDAFKAFVERAKPSQPTDMTYPPAYRL